MGWTTPRTWVPLEKPSAATMNTHIRDNLKYLHDQVNTSNAATGNATFTTDATFIRVGDVVYAFGGFARASSFSTSFVTAGSVPAGYRPASSITLPPGSFFNSTATYQIGIDTAGVVTIRMSAANSGSMQLSGFCWIGA